MEFQFSGISIFVVNIKERRSKTLVAGPIGDKLRVKADHKIAGSKT